MMSAPFRLWQEDDEVVLRFDDGKTVRAGLLIGADVP
jgi:2-polyprenyl-6-methoxyphenol hydroxylase-like FAD-dependent oxidoreductase